MESDAISATEDSLRDDIAAALSAADEPAQESNESEAQKQERARDESGRFAKKQETVETGTEAAPVDPEPASQPAEPLPAATTRKAPQSWKPEIKAAFDTLAPEVQEEILRRETDYNKGIQRYAESAKFAETIKPAIDKWSPYLSQLQITPDKAFEHLIQAEYNLRHGSPTQKQQAFMKLANDYGMSHLFQSGEQQQVDPNLQHYFDRVQQLEEQLRNQQYAQQQELQRKQQAEQAELQKQIEEFSSSPNRPHFEAVRDDMSRLLQAGYAESLEDAYDKAVWARPDIRSTLLKDQEAKRISEQAEVAKSAKAKAASIRGTPAGAAVPVTGASIRDDILAAMNGVGRL
jgi:hypothetical protein